MSETKRDVALGALRGQFDRLRAQSLVDVFMSEPDRAQKRSIELDGLLFDYSKHFVDGPAVDALVDFARACEVEEQRDAMMAGARINTTEHRAVLHTALRAPRNGSLSFDGRDVVPDVHSVLDRMYGFADRVQSGAWRGYTGQSITDVVNIGIGGSDLGPAMVYEALWPDRVPGLRVHYVSNVDGADLHRALERLDPGRTLFIIASKTFTTQETLTNALSARGWMTASGCPSASIKSHFVAVSTNRDAVVDFGIDPANMFEFWDWVGGRFSLWSAIGLSLVLGLGKTSFESLLRGAHRVDVHFADTPLDENLPVLMGLLGFWYTEFFGSTAHAVLPYDQGMSKFPAFLQQGEMESNGKSIDRDGRRVSGSTCPVVFGEPGTNGQHAFYQLLHQGTHLIPADFIAAARPRHSLGHHHSILLANCFAQSEALMVGRSADEVDAEFQSQGVTGERATALRPHKVFDGGRPSTTLLCDELTPERLGMLIALYEHKIFVQGALWNIHSFDQWGVELGKKLAKGLLPALESGSSPSQYTPSTQRLAHWCRQNA